MYGNRIVENISRPDKSELLKLERFSTPDVCDVIGTFDCMDNNIKPWIGKKKLIGPAITVKVPIGEGGIIPKAIDYVAEGDIIVISGQGNVNSAYWGDQRSNKALNKGAIGVIIDGAFRDIDDCSQIGLPIYAKGLTSGSSGKSGVGEINVPICCGGVVVCPGDIIFADYNGVCVIPKDFLSEVIERLEKTFKAHQ